MIDFFEGFQLAILRDLQWQAAARKARDTDSNSNSAQAENVPAESGKPNSRMHVSSASDAIPPVTGTKGGLVS
jgi:hypothetical protein